MLTTLVTGGAGFIGSNLVRKLLAERPGRRVLTLDLLTYAGHRSTLDGVLTHPRHRLVVGDVADPDVVQPLVADTEVDEIIHLAAESHVDRSIQDPALFVRTNVLGTQVMLDAARHHGVRRFLHVSTDEVYGHLGDDDPPFTEDSPLQPRSPYAASKAAADHLVRAAHITHGLPVLVTRCSNNYGPWQYPEKLVPVMVARVLDGRALPIFGTGQNVRDWIAVEDHCAAILAVLERGEVGRTYNIGGSCERTNLDVVDAIVAALGRPDARREFIEDRPGHDWRYALNTDRIRHELGWAPREQFDTGLRETVDWYVANQAWWRPLIQSDA